MNPILRRPYLIVIVSLIAIFLNCGSLFAYSNYQNANYVLGQPDFSTRFGSATQNRMNQPNGVNWDGINQRLFVTDSASNRLLVYDLSGGITNGMNASYVLGQTTFFNFGANVTQSGMTNPAGSVYDSTSRRLFVGDTGRVLVFDLSGIPAITNGMNASYVLGQSNFTTALTTTTQSGMGFTTGSVGYDTIRQWLFVAEFTNNRVLIFDLSGASGPLANGMNAKYVLGQSTWNTNGSNTTQNGMSNPTDVNYDSVSKQLFVVDSSNSRVLVFDLSGAITSGMNASFVLGQTNFTSALRDTTQSVMQVPANVTYDAIQKWLYVSDNNNLRVLGFDLSGGIVNGMNASLVLGQPDYTQSSLHAPFPNQSAMDSPAGLSYDAVTQRLFVANIVDNRVQVFVPPAPSCNALAICGTVRAAESPNPLLGGIPIELHDNLGRILRSQKTASNGTYRFLAADGLVLNNTYAVSPVVQRMQSPIPLQFPAVNLPSTGIVADFKIHGVAGNFKVTGTPPGSFILISTAGYAGANPPSITPSNAVGSGFYSAATGLDGTATVFVPAGVSYYLTCWLAQPSDQTVQYARSPASGNRGPYTSVLNQEVDLTCY